MRRWHLIALVLIVAALGITGCGDDDAATSTTVVPTTEAPTTTTVPETTVTTATALESTTLPSFQPPPEGTGEEWPPEFIAISIEACLDGMTQEQCECIMEEFQERYAFDDFFSWAGEAAPDDPRVVEVFGICAP